MDVVTKEFRDNRELNLIHDRTIAMKSLRTLIMKKGVPIDGDMNRDVG